MGLLKQVERLERIVDLGSDKNLEPSADLRRECRRILDEFCNRPTPTVQDKIEWLRDLVQRNDSVEEPWKFLNEWANRELAALEAQVAEIQ